MENSNLIINLSFRFREILVRMSKNDDIAKFILGLEQNQDYAYPFSFIDITDIEDQVSFIQLNKYKQIIDNGHRNVQELLWSSPSRSDVKIGRLIIKLAPIFKSADVENFVNHYKAEYKNMLKNIKFKVVEGEDILKYYNGKKYDRGSGSLNKSCMRYDQCASYMDLYKLNPTKIKMLILLDNKKDALRGRAILWKLDDPDTWFLDRIYTTDDSDTFLFKKHAEKNGWLYKNSQTFDAVNVMKDNKELFLEMRINDIKGQFDYFPYIDTLLYYNKKNKYLTNSEKDYNELPDVVKLREINGSDSGNENFIFDVINSSIINISDSIYCYYGDCYTYKNNVFFIDYLDEYCSSNQIRYSEYHKKFIADDSVYSYTLQSFMKRNEMNMVHLTKDKTMFDFLLKKDVNKTYASYSESNQYFLIELLTKGFDDNYYFIDEYDEDFIEKLKNKDRSDLDDAIKNSKILNLFFNGKEKHIKTKFSKNKPIITATQTYMGSSTYTSTSDNDRWWKSPVTSNNEQNDEQNNEQH